MVTQKDGGRQAKRIDGQHARALIARGAMVIDVRSPAEFDRGHVDGALNIPVDQLVSDRIEALPLKPIIVYCRSGARSAAAARALIEAGRMLVYDLGRNRP